MRGGKSFLILLVLALGFGAYLYFVEARRDVSDTDTPKPTKVWTLDENKIEEIQIHSAGGETTTLKKNGTTWQIVAPQTAEADEEAVSTIVSRLASLDYTKSVEDNPASVKQYELDPPRATVGIRLTGETAVHRLELGTKTLTGADVYARVEGQPKVFLLSSTTDDSVDRSTFDLRDKTVLKFDHDKADSLAIAATGGPAATLAKKGPDEWQLTAPSVSRADANAVETLVSKLSQAKMKSIAAEDGSKDLKKYGLDKPQMTVTIGGGSTRGSLELGSKAPDGSIYARDASRPIVFTVDATLIDDLKKKPEDLREKLLFAFRSFTAVNFDVTHGNESFSFAKQKAPAPAPNSTTPAPADTWKQTKPSARDVDQGKMTDFLINLANLKADSFTDHPASGGDEWVFTVRFGEDASPKEERVTFRKSGTVVQGQRQGEPSAAVVSTADFDKVVAGFKELAGIK
jgi:hypothetical protein